MKLNNNEIRYITRLLENGHLSHDEYCFKSFKENKLAEDEYLELVRLLKSELRFNIKKSYDKIAKVKNRPTKVNKIKKDPLLTLTKEGEKFLGILDKFELVNTMKGNKRFIRDDLLSIKQRIWSI